MADAKTGELPASTYDGSSVAPWSRERSGAAAAQRANSDAAGVSAM
jgi:hypothetical protein